MPLVTDLTDDPGDQEGCWTSSSPPSSSAGPISWPTACPPTASPRCAAPSTMAMKDKDLLADADKLDLEVNPLTGEEMQKVLAGGLCHAEGR